MNRACLSAAKHTLVKEAKRENQFTLCRWKPALCSESNLRRCSSMDKCEMCRAIARLNVHFQGFIKRTHTSRNAKFMRLEWANCLSLRLHRIKSETLSVESGLLDSPGRTLNSARQNRFHLREPP
jgi:hypothetical protein